jgi:type II secretory pathway component PulF
MAEGIVVKIWNVTASNSTRSGASQIQSPIDYIENPEKVGVKLQNQSSNDAMMSDIMEMSRSVLYGKRGGQYIADALKDSVIVVENKRLKTALMKLRSELDSGRPLDSCLDELEMSFSNGEISSFCTVIKSLQSTGQVDEALRTLENNI